MNRSWTDQLKKTTERFKEYWNARSKKQKWFIIGSFLTIIIALSIFIFVASRPQYIPLYTGQLSQREVGDIKAELDKEGFTDYQVNDTGTMLLVPKKNAPDLLVSLAAAGYPKDNKINFDIFSQNLTFGATDKQYDILEKEALQNKVADVIKNVDGIKNAEVILTLPQSSVFVRDDNKEEASASVMVEIEPGTKLNSQQIKALYTLVSHSVPNLPLENITIMNQYSETLAQSDVDSEDDQSLSKYEEQRKIQQDIQRDIQQNLQSLLGTIIGSEKVYVNTFVKMNFDKVKTQENLVKPTDDNNNGIVISSDKSSVTSTGTGSSSGGVVGTGETDVPQYSSDTSGGNSNYEQTQEKVNYEVNRINNEIVKSPYEIDDITINVGVGANSNKLPKATEQNIRNIVSNTVRTALGHPNLSQKEVDQRITIFPHVFAKNTDAQSSTSTNWLYIAGAAVAGMLLVGTLIWWLARRRKQDEDPEVEEMFTAPIIKPEDFDEQDMSVESQLRKVLHQRPEDFSKIIRTWLHDEEA
ncbi:MULTISPECIES: flagellar basal-body MS-ring/collar protein FliF [Bacillaceae]|uniref:flagellar basal-body MS-ring/collar protein FliF n=1 Tax=Bacillaceae TaxID=186817 RepID=UPI002FFD8B74